MPLDVRRARPRRRSNLAGLGLPRRPRLSPHEANISRAGGKITRSKNYARGSVGERRIALMQNTFSNALSVAIHNHIALSATRRETLGWLASLIMRHGTICLWRL